MALLSSLTQEIVDRRYPSFDFHITPNWINDFIAISGYKYQLTDQEKALPRSFITCLRDTEFNLFKILNINLNQLLHTTQKYEYIQDIYLNDWIRSESGIKRVSHRKGSDGPIVILEMVTQYFRGEELVTSSSGTVFVREESLYV